jgi:hypothetical protein
LAAVFRESRDATPFAQVYKCNTNDTNNATDWQKIGSAVSATQDDFIVDSVALSGDGTTIAVAMTSTATTAGVVSRQIYSLSDFQPVGELLVESLPYSAKFKTQLSLSNDAGLLTFGMTTEAGEGTFLLQTYQRSIANSWQRFGAALKVDKSAVAEISADGQTVALLDSKASRIFHLTSTGDWEDRMEGLPLDFYYRMALNKNGLVLATRQLSQNNLVEIFAFENGSWNHNGTVQDSDVYESNFGYQLDLSADGRTVVVATFRSRPTVAACVQAFQRDEANQWLPMGRPPCIEHENKHAAFGAYLALSGDGLLMAVGDFGKYFDFLDNGHIHTYALEPENEIIV